MIELDGRMGEGGGQLVRMACALAAVVTQSIRITHVRGNRGGLRGGGLKAQHVAAIEWLAKATEAEVSGLSVGSHTVEFRPKLKPSTLKSRQFKITASSAASSTMLIFQAIFPFLLFASGDGESSSTTLHPIDLEILGGTNVSFSLSYEYLDQVLLPTLEETFGIRVERQLKSRCWSMGKSLHGTVAFRVHPLPLGQPLRLANVVQKPLNDKSKNKSPVVETIDISLIAPTTMHASFTDALTTDLDDLFPNVPVNFKLVEESGSEARIYVLLVALSPPFQTQDPPPSTTSTPPPPPNQRRRRWGRDILTSTPRKPTKTSKNNPNPPSLSENISNKVCKELYKEISTGGVVDEFLQDQLVIFQALAEGISSFPSSNSSYDGGDEAEDLQTEMEQLTIDDEDDQPSKNQNKADGKNKISSRAKLQRDNRKKTQAPFGEGSTHTATARWVTTELLPGVAWYNDGRVCQGVGVRMEEEKEEGE